MIGGVWFWAPGTLRVPSTRRSLNSAYTHSPRPRSSDVAFPLVLDSPSHTGVGCGGHDGVVAAVMIGGPRHGCCASLNTTPDYLGLWSVSSRRLSRPKRISVVVRTFITCCIT